MKIKSLFGFLLIATLGSQSMFAILATYRMEGTFSYYIPGNLVYEPLTELGLASSSTFDRFVAEFTYETSAFTPEDPINNKGENAGVNFKLETDLGLSIQSEGSFGVYLIRLTTQNFLDAYLYDMDVTSNLDIDKFEFVYNLGYPNIQFTTLNAETATYENLLHLPDVPRSELFDPQAYLNMKKNIAGVDYIKNVYGHVRSYEQLSPATPPSTVPDTASTGLMLLLGMSSLGFVSWRQRRK